MALRPAACCLATLLLIGVVECGKPDGLGQFESHELDPGLDELPGGRTLVAHIVPLHGSHDGPLVGAAAVAWQPEPGLEALHGDGTLLPAAAEQDAGRQKGISFGFEHPSMLPGTLPNLSALEAPNLSALEAPAPVPVPAPAMAPTEPDPTQPTHSAQRATAALGTTGAAAAAAVAAAAAGRTVEAAAVLPSHQPVPTPKPVAAAQPAAASKPAAATQPAAASKPAAATQPAAASKPAAATQPAATSKPAAAAQPVAATSKPAAAAQPVAAQKPAASAQPAATPKPVPTPQPVPAAKPVATPQPVAAAQPAVTPQPPARVLLTQGEAYSLALPNPAVPQPGGVPASVVSPAAVAAGARTTLGRFKAHALPPYPLQANLAVSYANLIPVVQFARNHYYLHQIPPNPRAVVLMIHGCAGTAFNWWPQSAGCNNCRGMPEQMSHTIQALRRGYAVLAISAGDMSTGCWSWNDDADDVRDLVKDWLQGTKLKGLPLYGLGVSSGASFVLKLPRFFKFSGILSEALGIDPGPWTLEKVDGHFPPTLFVSMVKDAKQSAKIGLDCSILAEEGSPVGTIRAYERTIYPTYFSDRAPYNISQALSNKIRQGLLNIKMIDSFGKVLEEPRYTKRPWLLELQEQVPELGGITQWENGRALPQWPESAVNMNAKAVWSLVNLAYANHEIISDYATVAFAWFETGGAVDLQPLLDQYTYGRPPWQKARKALEEDFEPGQAFSVAHQPEAGLEAAAAAAGLSAAGADGAAAEQLSADESVARLGGLGAASIGRQGKAAAAAAPVTPRVGGPAGPEPLTRSILAGGVARCAAALTVVAAVAWLVVRSGRGGSAGAGLPAGALHALHATHAAQQGAHHAPVGAHGLPSIIPGVRERFDLTEVVEQTGSPFSARRRVRTAFHPDAPGQLGSPMRKNNS